MATKAKVTDVTGRQREALVKEQAAQQVRAAEELTMASAVESARLETEIVDLATPSAPTVIDEVEDLGVDLADDTTVIRVAEDLDMVTIGASNHYNFKAGQKYKVPSHVARHLEEKGYLYDRL